MSAIKRFIRRPEVIKKTGLSRTTIFNLERRNDFPRHIMLTPRCAAWDEAEVDAWLDARKQTPAKGLQGLDALQKAWASPTKEARHG